MKTNLTHELYKITHQPFSWWAFLLLLALMLYTAVPTAYVSKDIVAQGFGLGQWVIIIMIAVSANFVTMEFHNHTMTTLLYKSPNRQSVYLAKLLALVLYGVVLLAGGLLFALLIKLLLLNGRLSWDAVYHQQPLLQALMLNLLGVGVYLLFTVTLSLLLVSLVRSNATVIVIGLFIGFLGANLSAIAMEAVPGLRDIIAWNPLNMINVVSQLGNGAVMKVTALTNGELIAGNLGYALAFLLLGLWAFKKRPV